MVNTSLDSTFVNRLKHILETRYGKGLQIRQLMDLDGVQTDTAFTRGRDLHIPIQVNGSFLGTAVVPAADDLSSEKVLGITQLVRMALEPAMYNWYLERRESNLTELQNANLDLENVQLFGETRNLLAESDEDGVLAERNESPAPELVSHLIHLDGRSETSNKKAALQLHELTKRWAFVPFSDIKGQLHSAQDIARLGGMTIFIEKFDQLNTAEQELIFDYINEKRFSEEPLILTSSTLKIEELEKLEILAPLMDEISVNTFEVDRAPLTSQGLKDVLELFFIRDSSLDA
jgi:hypothetical protein